MHTHKATCIHTSIHVHVHMYMYITCTHAHIHVQNVHIHVHAHIHTLISTLSPYIAHPEASLDYSDSNPYRRRSMSATYQRPAPEGVGPQFGRAYPDANEMFFSLPNKTTTIVSTLSQKVRPNFVHLIHSNSAPVVMTDNGEGGRGRDHTAGKPSENEGMEP